MNVSQLCNFPESKSYIQVLISLVSCCIDQKHSEEVFLCICGRFDDGKPYEATYQVSREKAESLGIVFISWEASLEETIESLKEKGFLSF